MKARDSPGDMMNLTRLNEGTPTNQTGGLS